jgi:hypothetical protein
MVGNNENNMSPIIKVYSKITIGDNFSITLERED